MFARLFAESGLSLDRLRALVEVGASGSIAVAAGGDPVRQSQYSRQIKELEDFFRVELVERQGKGIRLTPNGRELARISRFFLLGLANFQRGCLAEEQTFRLGASATFIAQFLVPALTGPPPKPARARYSVETAADREIERRLHDLTLDFGVVTAAALSRPLQLRALQTWAVQLWVPKRLAATPAQAGKAFHAGRLPLAWAAGEIAPPALASDSAREPALRCDNFLEARAALAGQNLAAFLPDFLVPSDGFLRVRLPATTDWKISYRLAWNPRLLRLNPHATRCRDELIKMLEQRGPFGRP
jgi:DNA-binding transcriptional LysR family regulator